MKLYDRRAIAAMVAEFMGAIIFIMFGCLGCVESIAFPNGSMQKGINFGLLVMVNIQLFHAISGAQVNPCVTLSAMIMGELEWYMGLMYFLMQLLGNMLGYYLATVLGPQSVVGSSGFCVTTPAADINVIKAFTIEFALTSGWIIAMCSGWDQRYRQHRDTYGLRIGFVVAAMTISGIHFTGASMNPMRTLAPAILKGVYTDIWIYMTAPLLAAALISVIWRYFYGYIYMKKEGTTEGV